MLTLHPMPVPHQPGWTAEGTDVDRIYMLWAPRPAGPDQRAREQWSASWSGREGQDGGYRRGTDPEQAVAVLPTNAEGRRARDLLLSAARAHLDQAP